MLDFTVEIHNLHETFLLNWGWRKAMSTRVPKMDTVLVCLWWPINNKTAIAIARNLPLTLVMPLDPCFSTPCFFQSDRSQTFFFQPFRKLLYPSGLANGSRLPFPKISQVSYSGILIDSSVCVDRTPGATISFDDQNWNLPSPPRLEISGLKATTAVSDTKHQTPMPRHFALRLEGRRWGGISFSGLSSIAKRLNEKPNGFRTDSTVQMLRLQADSAKKREQT